MNLYFMLLFQHQCVIIINVVEFKHETSQTDHLQEIHQYLYRNKHLSISGAYFCIRTILNVSVHFVVNICSNYYLLNNIGIICKMKITVNNIFVRIEKEKIMADPMKINYKIFLEAEDVAQTRIISCTSYVKNILANHKNPYISRAVVDDESDMDDFVIRLFVEETIEEADCASQEMAEAFVDDMAELVTELAQAHSFLDMEGSFSIAYEGEPLAYAYTSASGDDGCDFQLMEDTE